MEEQCHETFSFQLTVFPEEQIREFKFDPENQATEGKDVLELQGRGPQMERTNRWSARSFQRLQTISSSISSLILLSSTSAGFLLSGKFQLMIQQRIGPGDGTPGHCYPLRSWTHGRFHKLRSPNRPGTTLKVRKKSFWNRMPLFSFP